VPSVRWGLDREGRKYVPKDANRDQRVTALGANEHNAYPERQNVEIAWRDRSHAEVGVRSCGNRCEDKLRG